MSVLVWILAIPIVAAVVGSLASARPVREGAMIGGLAMTFVLSLVAASQFLRGQMPSAFGDALRLDGLSALVLVLCAFVGLLSALYGAGYLRRNDARGLVTTPMRREFYGLMPAYVFAILFVSMSNNLGILWIAVELTTLVSVFLVAFHNQATSLEAAWKFLMLGSLGLAFALLGTVLLYASGQTAGESLASLHWTRLMAAAPHLHPLTLRLAVVFALIGYGTKAGLAPMHTWKPDAYGEAPSPAGVLMAVGMLNAALYSVVRIHAISTAALGPEFSGSVLLTLGVLSVLIATPFMLIQWNLKRLLAYSSIEHAGIMAIGFGLGVRAGVFGALLHMTYHSLAKPVAFFSAGSIAQRFSTSDMSKIGGGTMARASLASALLIVGAVLITGTPPSGIFFSELIVLRAGFVGSHPAVAATLLAALVVLFCGLAFQIGRLVLGRGTAGNQPRGSVFGPNSSLAPLSDENRPPGLVSIDLALGTALAAAIVAIISAFYLPAPLLDLIHAAADVVGGRS